MDDDSLEKDMEYSPASDTDTEAKQKEPAGDAVKPGTGGPDDSGDLPDGVAAEAMDEYSEERES